MARSGPGPPCRTWPAPAFASPTHAARLIPCHPAGAKGIEEGTWQENWQATESSKCLHLLRRLLEVGAAVPPGSKRQPTAKAIVHTQARRGGAVAGGWGALCPVWPCLAG